MKPVCTLLALAVALPLAAAAGSSLEGTFGWTHDVGMLGYRNKRACLQDKGRWSGGVCLLEGEDTVAVAKEGEAYSVVISTVTTNAHLCDFTGKGELISPREIIASADACKVSVKYGEDDTVSVKLVSSYESCQDFCGMNAGLEIERAKRK